MRTITYRALLASLAVMAAGCGGDSASDASCNLANLSCIDFTGNGITKVAAQAECVAEGGTFASAACATANRVGSCSLDQAGLGNIVIRFYSPITVSDARSACTSPGVFTPN